MNEKTNKVERCPECEHLCNLIDSLCLECRERKAGVKIKLTHAEIWGTREQQDAWYN